MERVSRSSPQLSSICASCDFVRLHYSTYGKLYFVGLTRLQKDATDQTIYDWFVQRGARPVLITPTHVHGQVKSRGRTVYFYSVGCPAGLFESTGEPSGNTFRLGRKAVLCATPFPQV
ncbi:hypothetical protein Plhal703r1_c01g0000181 [Plasmopara halstedii]